MQNVFPFLVFPWFPNHTVLYRMLTILTQITVASLCSWDHLAPSCLVEILHNDIYYVFSDIMFVTLNRLWWKHFHYNISEWYKLGFSFPFLLEERLTILICTPLLWLIVLLGPDIWPLFTVCPLPLPALPLIPHTSPGQLFLKYNQTTYVLKTLQCCLVLHIQDLTPRHPI